MAFEVSGGLEEQDNYRKVEWRKFSIALLVLEREGNGGKGQVLVPEI